MFWARMSTVRVAKQTEQRPFVGDSRHRSAKSNTAMNANTPEEGLIMTTNEVVVCTPRYVLLDENRRLGPMVIPSDIGVGCSAIYGFSDKGTYDRFCANSDLALRPYPLVEGYLRIQVGVSDGDLKLIVLDADGPHERCLHAATMEAVLEAQENRAAGVNTGYRLILDPKADAYRVEEAPMCR